MAYVLFLIKEQSVIIMTEKKSHEIKTDPSKLDEVADQKYPYSAEKTTKELDDQIKTQYPDPTKPDFRNADDGASSSDEEDFTGDGKDNVSEQEVEDLDNAANRMPDEQDDIADNDILDDQDEDGAPLNESEDALGEDLDIEQNDEDANLYDDNE